MLDLEMLGLDTSIVVRLLVGEPAAQAAAARRLLDTADAPIAISDLVVSEAYHALRHHYAVPHAAAVAALRTFVLDRRVHVPGVARHVLERVPERESGPGVMDRLIHADYAREAAALVTFDRAAARLPGAQLLTV